MIHLPPKSHNLQRQHGSTPRVCILPMDIFHKSLSVLYDSFKPPCSSGTFSGYFIILFRPHFILKLKQYSLRLKIMSFQQKNDCPIYMSFYNIDKILNHYSYYNPQYLLFSNFSTHIISLPNITNNHFLCYFNETILL